MAVAAGVKAAPAPGLAQAQVLGLRGSRGARWGDEGGTAAPGRLWASCECPAGCRELWFRGWAAAGAARSQRVSHPAQDSDGEREDSPATRARQQLEALLNKTMRIRMTDGRTLVGCFLCTDRDCNVILGSAQEFLKPSGQCPGNAHPPGNAAEPHARQFSSSACLHRSFSGAGSHGPERAGPTLARLPDALTLLSRFLLCRGTPCAGSGHGTRTPHRFH
uniref:N-alpha-acetyltransferase 38, NatC auxiliary subunit n=1 Tax=Equus asinus TaxID=9793 RepID=A0A9L0KCB5_EQUAS